MFCVTRHTSEMGVCTACVSMSSYPNREAGLLIEKKRRNVKTFFLASLSVRPVCVAHVPQYVDVAFLVNELM